MMKAILLFLFLPLIAFKVIAQNQISSDSLTLPDFRFYTVTDSNVFTRDSLEMGKPIVLIYFKTDCPYCQAMTKNIVAGFDSLRAYQVVMISTHSPELMRNYAHENGLDKLPVRMLHDPSNRIHDYYHFEYIPLVCLYDQYRKRIYAHEGRMTVKGILYRFGQGGKR